MLRLTRRLIRLTLDRLVCLHRREFPGDHPTARNGIRIATVVMAVPISRKCLACLVALTVLQAACYKPTVRPDQLAQPDRRTLGRVAVVPAAFEPEHQFDAFTTGNDEAAKNRAASNASDCAVFLKLMAVPIAGWVAGPVLAVGCVPVAAVASTPKARSQAEVEGKKLLTDRTTAGLKVQEIAAERTARYANEAGYRVVLLPGRLGPSNTDAAPLYVPLQDSADSLIEIVVTRVEAVTTGKAASDPVFIRIHLRARLLNVPEKRIVDSFSHEYTTPARTVDAWLADEGKWLEHDIEEGLGYLGAQTIDEMLLVYHPQVLPLPRPEPEAPMPATTIAPLTKPAYTKSPAAEPKGPERVPAYALRPIEPPLRYHSYRTSRTTLAHLERYQLDTLQPTLRWEPWPRGFDITPGSEAGQAQDVRYEVRIFFASPGMFAPASTLPFYERTGLRSPEHTVEQALEPCMTYRWTVRAAFVLNDAPRVTEWTGAYHNLAGSGFSVEPWEFRRGRTWSAQWQPSMNMFFPIVETPSTNGARCPNR